MEAVAIFIFFVIIILGIWMVCISGSESFTSSLSPNSGPIILPIQFAIPECMIREPGIKKQKFAPMVPGKKETYIYNDEDSYYLQYNESWFGITKSKAGHDCLRHYEIIAAGAIPWFENIDKIPQNTMHKFPKDLVQKAMKAPENEYPEYLKKIQDYARKYLTTKALGQYFLDAIGYDGSKILFVSKPHSVVKTDYQRDCVAMGLVELMKSPQDTFVDFYEDLPWMFEDYKTCTDNYGKGFTLCGKLPSKYHNPKTKEQVLSSDYNIIVVATSSGSSKIDPDLINKIKNSSSKKVLIIGNDGYHYSRNHIRKYISENYPGIYFDFVFCRELKD